jgi:uncharacterized peroxidase-related enzyme
MSWIRSADATLPSPAAGSEETPDPEMASLSRALALHAPGLEAVVEHGRALTKDPSPLSSTQVELIAVVVSATNGCAYCVAHYGSRLARALGDEKLARAVARDYREANLAARDRVLLDHAVALTCEPSERKLEDVERVREYGFDDAAILLATHLAAYFGLVNRLASGLGVALEPSIPAWEFGDQR